MSEWIEKEKVIKRIAEALWFDDQCSGHNVPIEEYEKELRTMLFPLPTKEIEDESET